MATRAENRVTARAEKRVRISDLAEHLNLTKGTVSRALNGYPDIAVATRLRVRNAAAKMGYRPLSQAQAIRTGRSRALGLVLQDNEHDGHRPFVDDFVSGVSQAAAAVDWTLTVTTARDEAHTLRLLRDLAEDRKADGFILPRTKLDDPRITALKAAGTPFILYGRTRDPENCAWYDIESEAAMDEAVARMAEQGHRRIGFVPGTPGYTYTRLRQEGYLRSMRRLGLKTDLIASPAVTHVDGAKATEDLLGRGATAVVYSVDHAAMGAYGVARAHGLRIGRDLSIISYDGVPEGALMDPPLSTFAVDIRRAGEELARMLIALCRGAPPEETRALARARFFERGSNGPAPVKPTQREELS